MDYIPELEHLDPQERRKLLQQAPNSGEVRSGTFRCGHRSNMSGPSLFCLSAPTLRQIVLF